MSKVVEVTDQSFEEEVLNSDLPTELDFWAPWCGPCRMVAPIYDQLSEEYDGKFKFCKIGVDKNQRTAMKYQIMSIPMQIFSLMVKRLMKSSVPSRSVLSGKWWTASLKVPQLMKISRLEVIIAFHVELNRQYGKKLDESHPKRTRG